MLFMKSMKLFPIETFTYMVHYTDVLSGSKTRGTKAPAIHVHSMDYSHRSLMHAVATYVNYFNTIISYDDMIVLRETV